ncbi:MAG: energy transducer TonB [Pseudomonadota bacterium]
MADVLIVCVREDEPQAKALADMFERAGFAVGGAPSNDGALRSSGAAVVVWSQASIRSRPFLDAAQRVVNAKKAVVACLIDPPPAASINDSPAFDLRGWTGDPDDPMLDPLFFGVDRMVNAARAAVGAPAAQPAAEPFEPPPSLRPPPSTPPYARSARTAPPQTRQPPAAPLPPGFQMRGGAQQPPVRVRTDEPAGGDPLGSEAEHWRSIRHSNDPTVFLDYLAKYGPDGAFSELAEQRLRQIEPNAGANLRSAARGFSEPAPPARAPAASRREATPQRRREPAFEAIPETPRYYDKRDEKRAQRPPKQGGWVRFLVLFLILGAAAFGGALYFGLQPSQFGGLVSAHDDAQSSAPSSTNPSPQTYTPQREASNQDEPASSSFSDATPPRIEVASNNTRSSAPITSRSPPPQRQRDPTDSQTPAPQASWSNSSAPAPATNPSTAGGPVSLMPNPAANDNLGSANTPVSLSASQATPQTAAPASHGIVTWAQRPTATRVAAQYPDRAARNGIGGRVDLDCTIGQDLGVSCSVAAETPPGQGFGRAALNLVSSFRAEHFLSDGTPAAGVHVRVPIVFQPPRN